MVTIQTVELERKNFPAPRGDFLGPYVDWDQNNNQHEIYVEQAGTLTDDSTTFHYVKKNAQGATLDSGTIQPPTDANGRAMKYVHIGAPLIIIPPNMAVGSFVVPFTAHGAGPNGGRTAIRDYHVIPAVYAPHPRGEKANELYDVELPGETGGTMALSEEDKAWITAQLAPLVRTGQFGDQGVRQGIEDKAKDAVRELNMWSQSMQDRGVDKWVKDRVFEVLRDNGLLGRTQQAHAEDTILSDAHGVSNQGAIGAPSEAVEEGEQ